MRYPSNIHAYLRKWFWEKLPIITAFIKNKYKQIIFLLSVVSVYHLIHFLVFVGGMYSSYPFESYPFLCRMPLLGEANPCIQKQDHDEIMTALKTNNNIATASQSFLESIKKKSCTLNAQNWNVGKEKALNTKFDNAILFVSDMTSVDVTYRERLDLHSYYEITINPESDGFSYIFSFKSAETNNELEISLNTKDDAYDVRYNNESQISRNERMPLCDNFGKEEIVLSVPFTKTARSDVVKIGPSFTCDVTQPLIDMANINKDFGDKITLAVSVVNNNENPDFSLNFPDCVISSN